MAFESITDDFIQHLLKCPKQVLNSRAKKMIHDGNEKINYNLQSTDKDNYKFRLFVRQNSRVRGCFSVGLIWESPSGENLILTRYNGNSHVHQNDLEKENFEHCFHVHIATERYIRTNKKPEKYAYPHDGFTTVEGALHCLVQDCNIVGLNTQPDNCGQVTLFDDFGRP